MKKLAARIVAILTMLCLTAGAAIAQSGEGSIDLTGHIVILHTGDVFGNADENLGYRSAAIAGRKLEGAGATVFLLDSGNAMGGRAIASLSEGEAIVRLMNAAGYDAMAAAGAELKLGAQRLAELAGLASFPILSANAADEEGSAVLEGALVLEKGNVRLGVFALTEGTEADGGVCADPIAAAKEQMAYLEAQSCTLIVALANFGAEQAGSVSAEQIASQVPGIDILIDGGRTLEDGLWADGTLIVSAGSGLESIGCIDIAPDGLTAATLLTGEDFLQPGPEEEIDRLIAAVREEQKGQMTTPIGRSSVELNGEEEAVRTGETNLGSFAADAARSAADADAAIISGGSIGGSVPAGDLTRALLEEAFPSAKPLVKQRATGAQLLMLLEEAVSLSPAADARFPQVSGVTFSFDPAQPAGSRVFGVMVGAEPLDEAKSYVLALDEAYVLRDAPILEKTAPLAELTAGYIATFETDIAPETEGRTETAVRPAS